MSCAADDPRLELIGDLSVCLFDLLNIGSILRL